MIPKPYLCTLLFKTINLNKKTDEFYKNLKIQLEETSSWPSVYLYKFIVPANQGKEEKIQDIFNNTGAKITTKNSSKGTYTSLSITVNMKTANHVIEKYIEVSKVEGVISL